MQFANPLVFNAPCWLAACNFLLGVIHAHSIRNLRYSIRGLRRRPGMTAAILTTLMIGIGATTAIYTLVYAVLIAPLPYPNANQLVVVWSYVNSHRNGVSAGDFLDWQRQSTSFQQLTA